MHLEISFKELKALFEILNDDFCDSLRCESGEVEPAKKGLFAEPGILSLSVSTGGLLTGAHKGEVIGLCLCGLQVF